MNNKQNIMFEYLEVSVKQNMVKTCSDCYKALGWTISSTRAGIGMTTIKLNRSKKIKNRTGLYDLQHICEDAFNAIEKVESTRRKRQRAANIWVRIAGTSLMTASLLAYQADKTVLFIVLIILGLTGCLLPSFISRGLIDKKMSTERVFIDKKLEIIREASKKASELLQ